MHRVLVAAACGPALLLAAACSAPTGETSLSRETGAPAQGVLPVTRLRAEPWSFTYNSGMDDSARVVVRDADAWRQVWSAVWRRHSPEPELPAADFTREMLVVAALGSRPTGGYSIYVDSAYQRAGHVEVVVRKVSPGPRCGTGQAFSQPVDIARLPASGDPVRFRERAVVHDCP